MRKLLTAFAVVFVSAALGFADADSRWGIDTNSDGTNEINVNAAGVLSMPGGLMKCHEYWYNPPAASTITVAHTVSLTTAAVAISTTITAITNMAKPLSIRCSFDTTTGSSNVRGNVVITGFDAMGEAQTETMDINSLTVAESSGAYSSITSIKYTITANADGAGCSNLYCNAGPGRLLGFANKVTSSDDIIKVVENGTHTTAYTINTTWNTIDFVTDPNGSSYYEAWYTVQTSQ